jgi:hypothetical protein
MEKTAVPVPAQDAVQVAHPLCCWICEIVVELGVGDGCGVGEAVGAGDGAGEAAGAGNGEADEEVVEKLPFPHPANKVENNKVILSTTATVSCFS